MTTSDDFTTFDHATDVDAAALAAAASTVTEGGKPPVLEDPLDGPVTLPAGFRRAKADGQGATRFVDVRKAWVRELNGEDEERIARARMKEDFGAWLSTILECGVERLGDEAPTRDDLASLVVGDQQYLFLEIARATFGDELEYENFTCPWCSQVFNVSLSISEDIPVRRLDKSEDAMFEVALTKDRVAVMGLPTGEMNDSLAHLETGAESNTVIIAHAVQEIRNPDRTSTHIAGDLDEARRLSYRDRKTIVKAVGDRMVGPQYNEVKFVHEVDGCGKEVRLDVTPADLFREM